MAEAREYHARAMDEIVSLLDREHAVHLLELEARLSEGRSIESGGTIDPHHLTSARIELIDRGVVAMTSAPTRGGRSDIPILQPTNRHRRATAIDRAAARKRLLAARYLGWAEGSREYPHGLVGPAGEVVLRKSIVEAATLRLKSPGGGEISELAGIALPGPVDSGGLLVVDDERGMPLTTVAVLVEMKNVRGWLYPTSHEPYQLLMKAAYLQQAAPHLPVMPVLVCRKAHKTLFKMARQMGFFVVSIERQYLRGVQEAAVAEVREGLGFLDLTLQQDADVRLVRRFRQTVPAQALKTSIEWRKTVEERGVTRLFSSLRQEHLMPSQRRALMEALRSQVHAQGLGGW